MEIRDSISFKCYNNVESIDVVFNIDKNGVVTDASTLNNANYGVESHFVWGGWKDLFIGRKLSEALPEWEEDNR